MAVKTYNVGNIPPRVIWTIVRGDTSSFKVYVTDDAKQPLNIPDWTIKMDIERAGDDIVVLYPSADVDDANGEFTVSITAAQSELLETDDVFDIQLTDLNGDRIWTVAQGKMVIIEDITE